MFRNASDFNKHIKPIQGEKSRDEILFLGITIDLFVLQKNVMTEKCNDKRMTKTSSPAFGEILSEFGLEPPYLISNVNFRDFRVSTPSPNENIMENSGVSGESRVDSSACLTSQDSSTTFKPVR